MERGLCMQKRIAQIGTFDIENFGDLLFPTMLAHVFSDDEIDLFSVEGNCPKPFEENIYVYPVAELEKMHCKNPYDAIVIGGGDIILCDVNDSSKYLWSKCDLFKLWASPILIGNKYNIPVIFNAPGVPFQFNESMRSLVGELLNKVDYLSVRDEMSATFLKECGVANVKVVPDTIIEIENVFQQPLLKNIRKQLQIRYKLPEDDSYIVMQHNTFQITNTVYKKYYKTVADRVIQSGKKVVFMPIGYVHEDGDFLKQIYDSRNKNQVYIDGMLSPLEMCAVLAGSCGYIGSSMHGAVVSYSYKKFAVCINTKKYTKTAGLLKLLGHPEWEVKNIADLETVFLNAYSEELTFPEIIHDRIKKHFSDIKGVINGLHISKDMPDILKSYFELEKKINDSAKRNFSSATVYFDYGEGYKAFECIEQKYKILDDGQRYFHLNIPRGVIKIRIDFIEEALIIVDSLKVLLDGQVYEPQIGNKLELESGYLINTLMPSIECVCENRTSVEIFIKGSSATLNQLQELIGSIHYDSMLKGQAYDERIVCLENEKQKIQIAMNDAVTKYEKEKDEFQCKIDSANAIHEKEKKELQCKIDNITVAYKKEKQELQDRINNAGVIYEKKIANFQEKIKTLEIDKIELQNQVDALNTSCLAIRDNLNMREDEIECIKNSVCWKLTAPIRVTGNGIYHLMMKTYFTQCALEAIKILFTKGPKEVVLACGRFIDRTRNSNEANSLIPGRPANNRDGYNAYDCEYQENQIFSGQPDVKMLAFYLPQYHAFPENDEWWGKGFTEWVNVKNGESRFQGHYQPRVPHKDIGYYSLDNIDVLARQAKLAKQHGIYGFCFYYYWFSGKRLMEKPVDMLLEHPEIDLPFCLCWANENWTRAWDGQNRNILIAQEYSEEDDRTFILDMKKYIDDSRYIRIDGKPLIMVYNPGQIPDCHKSFKKWRECAKKIGIGDILIWTCQTANNTADILNITDCIDAEVEFPPHNMWLESLAVRDLDLNGKSAFIYNYQCLVDYEVKKLKNDEKTTIPIHHSCMMAWDNAARRKDAWFTYYAFSLRSLYKWVLAIAQRARKDFKEEERFVFVNAWNEWGEGTYLEPDEKYGYANINTVSKALYEMPLKNDICILNEKSNAIDKLENNKNIAVHIHMFYLETLEETIQNINYIPYDFDCFVSTDTHEKKAIIEKQLKEKCSCRYFEVRVFENRGRDVAPFIVQMAPVIERYDYICHIHSKKTKTGEYGNEWRKYIFHHLFGNKKYLEALFALFEQNKEIGLIMPETFPVLELQAEWGGNLEGVRSLLERIACGMSELPQEPVFPVGNMFWARVNAVFPMFSAGLTQADFPEEAGQVNATIAHQIERSWVYVAESQGYIYKKVYNDFKDERRAKTKRRLGIFVHYDAKNVVSDEDIRTLESYQDIISDIIFVTNSNLSDEELNKVSRLTSQSISRPNIGLDFGAWKEVLCSLGRNKVTKYDEVILFNNSCYAPLSNMNRVFSEMEERNVDFWGITLFPYSPNGEYIHKSCIPEHLQSYFTVYNHRVIASDAFWNFWENMKEYDNYIDVVGNCESQFTKILHDAGFTYEPYVLESYYMNQYLQNYSIPYEKPTTLILLGDPLVKKKSQEYINEEERIKLKYLMENL